MASRKAAKKPAALDLADELESLPAKGGRRDWFKFMEGETREQLLAVRAKFRTGKLNHHSKAEIYRHCKARLALCVCFQTFCTWLASDDE